MEELLKNIKETSKVLKALLNEAKEKGLKVKLTDHNSNVSGNSYFTLEIKEATELLKLEI